MLPQKLLEVIRPGVPRKARASRLPIIMRAEGWSYRGWPAWMPRAVRLRSMTVPGINTIFMGEGHDVKRPSSLPVMLHEATHALRASASVSSAAWVLTYLAEIAAALVGLCAIGYVLLGPAPAVVLLGLPVLGLSRSVGLWFRVKEEVAGEEAETCMRVALAFPEGILPVADVLQYVSAASLYGNRFPYFVSGVRTARYARIAEDACTSLRAAGWELEGSDG